LVNFPSIFQCFLTCFVFEFSRHYDSGVSLKRYFVLLHDNVDGPKDFDDQYAIDIFHNSFPGQSFRVLRINSVVSNSLKNHQPDLWVDDVLDISLLNNDSNKTVCFCMHVLF